MILQGFFVYGGVWDLQELNNGWTVDSGDFLWMADRIFTGISL